MHFVKIKTILILALLCHFQHVVGQEKEVFMENDSFRLSFLNIKTESPAIEEVRIPYKDKKVIIDFFSSYCIVCFRMLPKIDSIQKQYADQLKVFLIGNDDSKIRSIYGRLRERYNLGLSVAYDIDIFERLKIREVPRYLWIDEKGKVIAFTGVEDMTIENVRSFLSNGSIQITKKETNMEFDPEELIFSSEGLMNKIKVRSMLTLWEKQMPFFIPPKLEASYPDKFQVLGGTLSSLYTYAHLGIANWRVNHPYYGKVFPFPVIKAKCGSIVIHLESETRFCYSVFKAKGGLGCATIQTTLKKDLELYTGYSSQVVEMEVPCWELVGIKGEEILVARNELSETTIDPMGFTLKNKSVDELIRVISKYNSNDLPILNNTGIDYNIDIAITANMEDLSDISKNLRLHGIELKKSYGKMKVILLEKL